MSQVYRVDTATTGDRGDWFAPLGATLAMQATGSYLFNVVPTLAPSIVATTAMSPAFVGWLVAVNTLGSIAFMAVGTPLIRRYGAIRALQAGVLLGLVGAMLFAVPSALAIVVGSILMGLGYGPSSPAGSDILQRFAPPRYRVTIFSIRQAGVPLSGVIAGLLLPQLYTFGGWGAVTAATALIVTAAVLAVEPVRARVDVERDRGQVITLSSLMSPANLMMPIRAVTAAPGLRRIAMAGACLAVGHGCWSAYFVTYATDVLHLSLIEAGGAFAVMQACCIAGRVMLGWLADRIGSGIRVLSTVSLLSAATSIGLVALGSGLSYAGLCGLAAIAGLTISSWNGVQVATIAGRADRRNITASASGATMLVFMGYVAGPAAFAALLAATGSYTVAFAATALVTLAAAPLLAGLAARDTSAS